MGRKSALSDKQWEKIGQRLLAGESTSQLAREYGVSKSTISGRFSERTNRVKAAAGLIVQTETALQKLTVSERISARSVADDLMEMSRDIVGAGRLGAATAFRLAEMAHDQVQKVNPADLDGEVSEKALKNVGKLARLKNEAGAMAINIMSASNKDAYKHAQQAEQVMPVKITIQVEDASIPEPEAQ